MKQRASTTGARRGGLLPVMGILLVLLVAVVGFLGYLGWQAQVRFSGFLDEGNRHIHEEKPELAAAAFQKADAEFGTALSLYRAVRRLTGATFLSQAEVAELIVSAALLCTYDDVFILKASTKWVELAEAHLGRVPEPPGRELTQNVATARELANLCRLFAEQKYEDVMKGLLAAEKNALPTDTDFFTAEVRLLIACGKALNEQAILQQARELLFFLTYEAELKNKKTESLWGILNR